MRQQRFDGIASAHRDDSVEDNLKHFAEMTTGSEEGQRWCLRAKMSVDDPNKALRDPVIYRCNITPHHRTGFVKSVSYEHFTDVLAVQNGKFIRHTILPALSSTLSKASLTLCVRTSTVTVTRSTGG